MQMIYYYRVWQLQYSHLITSLSNTVNYKD